MAVGGCSGASRHESVAQRATEDYDRIARATEAFGQRASAAERKAVSGPIDSYLAAAYARKYVRACALLSRVAQKRRGPNCPAELSRAFKEWYWQGASRLFNRLQVTEVRIQGNYGYAFILKRPSPEAQLSMPIRREGGMWRPDVFAPSPVRTQIVE